jgi:hypothetical protein
VHGHIDAYAVISILSAGRTRKLAGKKIAGYRTGTGTPSQKPKILNVEDMEIGGKMS